MKIIIVAGIQTNEKIQKKHCMLNSTIHMDHIKLHYLVSTSHVLLLLLVDDVFLHQTRYSNKFSICVQAVLLLSVYFDFVSNWKNKTEKKTIIQG